MLIWSTAYYDGGMQVKYAPSLNINMFWPLQEQYDRCVTS